MQSLIRAELNRFVIHRFKIVKYQLGILIHIILRSVKINLSAYIVCKILNNM
jgi:hypothetical protein